MAISPQGIAVTAGGIRRKRRSPYIDMIRGQYGQATENVIQQRAQDLREKESAATQEYQQSNLDLAKEQMAIQRRQAEQQRMLDLRNQRLREKADKRAGQFGLASTIMEGVNTGVNLYNATGGFGGLGGAIGSGVKKYGSKAASGLVSFLGNMFDLL